ncbi:MAG: hypothetical protein PWQ11_496 [Candidatus Diapherotrites archaeon]|nr:hypothetical protein [Candidatus Diapherotrites archaeon]
MDVPDVRPGESVYVYLERVKKFLGTNYVYVIYDNEILAPIRGDVNIRLANTVVTYARTLAERLPDFMNTVIAVPDGLEGRIVLRKLGSGAYLAAFLPEEKIMRIEEFVV